MSEQNQSETDDTTSAAEYVDEVTDLETAVDNFTAILSRIEHDHGPFKSLNDDDDDNGRRYSNHDLRGRFNVRDDFVKSHLFSQTNDHLSVYEMGVRSDEFRGDEARVFRDMDEDTSEHKRQNRWDEIRRFAGLAEGTDESAPTPPEAKNRLKQVLELRDETGFVEVPEQVREVTSATA